MDRLRLEHRGAPELPGSLPRSAVDRLLESGELCRFEQSDNLVCEGDEAKDAYLLLEGEVSVWKGEAGASVELARRRAPDWVGEAALLEAGCRSATVRAEEPVRALRLQREDFLELCRRIPEAALAVLQAIAPRLRESDEQLVAALGARNRELASHNRELARENHRLCYLLDARKELDAFIGASEPASRVRAAARQAAASELPALLLGESGTGKELLARAIHAESARAAAPFVPLNCAHLTETLLESVLFGHARGAFTGATHARAGLVEAAHGGTLFLDEVGDMPISLQGALLRFLDSRGYRRLGETELRRADVRLIAATHRDLDREVESGGFRRDLLYRLDVLRISIPPLRERREDLPALVEHIIDRVAVRLAAEPLRLAPDALAALQAGSYPGNVRELENEIERLYALRREPGDVQPDQLSPRILGGTGGLHEGYAQSVRRFKQSFVEAALREAGGNRAHAAAALGVHRSNLVRMIRELGLELPEE